VRRPSPSRESTLLSSLEGRFLERDSDFAMTGPADRIRRGSLIGIARQGTILFVDDLFQRCTFGGHLYATRLSIYGCPRMVRLALYLSER
jgi:hypothetical protein